MIGENGDIVRLKDGEKNKKYMIQEAGTGQGKFGYLKESISIGDDIYVCGVGKQIYKNKMTSLFVLMKVFGPNTESSFWLH